MTSATASAELANSPEARQDELSQVVSFHLGEEEYGVDIMKVQEIILMGQITRLPGVPEFIRGLINLRGHVIPVVDLRWRLGLGATESTEDTRIIVVSMAGKTVGLIVDSVSEVLRIDDEQVEPAPKSVAGIGQEYLLGLAKLDERIVILLDIEKVLSDEDHRRLADLADQQAAEVAQDGDK